MAEIAQVSSRSWEGELNPPARPGRFISSAIRAAKNRWAASCLTAMGMVAGGEARGQVFVDDSNLASNLALGSQYSRAVGFFEVVVNGNVVNRANAPFLSSSNPDHIGRFGVLPASVISSAPAGASFRVGVGNFNSPTAVRSDVINITVKPGFDGTVGSPNNISVFQLASSLPLVTPLPFGSAPPVDTSIIAASFGALGTLNIGNIGYTGDLWGYRSKLGGSNIDGLPLSTHRTTVFFEGFNQDIPNHGAGNLRSEGAPWINPLTGEMFAMKVTGTPFLNEVMFDAALSFTPENVAFTNYVVSNPVPESRFLLLLAAGGAALSFVTPRRLSLNT